MATLLERGADVNARTCDGESAAELVDFDCTDGEGVAMMLMRGGADFSGIDLTAHARAHSTWVKCGELRMQLQHLCREKVRTLIMANHRGEHIGQLTNKLGLPSLLHAYVANAERYDLECDEWML